MKSLSVNSGEGSLQVEIDEHKNPNYVMVLAHGAGAPMTHPFMTGMGQLLSDQGGIIIRFNFPYVAQGRKSPGSPAPNVLTIGTMIEFATDEYPPLPLFLGGKSYGGRMGSHWLAQNPGNTISGIIYFGFPLHAPGRDSMDRADHLYDLTIPQLFIQGTRDTLANYSMITEVVNRCNNAELFSVDHGDHSFKVPKKLSGKSGDEILGNIANHVTNWVGEIC